MQRKAFNISGQVQGVGFRPFVYRLAKRLGLTGSVRNGPEGVHIEVQGPAERLKEFSLSLQDELPPLARISALQEEEIEALPCEETFRIVATSGGDAHQVLISPDVATCEDCLRDLQDEQGRRYRYPFTNCTNCGPRYTITRQMPYDRPSTSMSCFPLCPECAREYGDPADRRFHAQPNACPVCGPRVWLLESAHQTKTDSPGRTQELEDNTEPKIAGTAVSSQDNLELAGKSLALRRAVPGGNEGGKQGLDHDPKRVSQEALHLEPPTVEPNGGYYLQGDDALKELAHRLAGGAIAAIKGLGGFHLVCDATNDEAIARLRAAKQRPHKPLAIMVGSLNDAAKFVQIGPGEERLLTSLERPIVLCRVLKRPDRLEENTSTVTSGFAESMDSPAFDTSRLSRSISPDTGYVGVMLPYTPLHHVLLNDVNELAHKSGRGPAALVMTSGNRGGEPIALGNREALQRLGGIADVFLLHDRDILIRTDDSVLRPLPESALQPGDAPVLYLRRARGFVPAPLALPKAYENQDGQERSPAGSETLRSQRAGVEARQGNAEAQFSENDPEGISVQNGERPTLLALGADLKNTVCINRGGEAFVSQHIGDQQNLETSSFQAEIATHLAEVLQVRAEGLVLDAHPDFANQSLVQSDAWAALPRLSLQHHFAHAEAVLAENCETGPALILALDGTGYAPPELNSDKSIWGGELIFAHPAKNRLERIGGLGLIPLPGGEAAIRQPWRIAHGLLCQLGLLADQPDKQGPATPEAFCPVSGSWHDGNVRCSSEGWQLPWLPEHEKAARLIPQMLAKNINTPMTSSAGRLFDAVSALLGICLETSYEGQAAIRLEEAQYDAGFQPDEYQAIYRKVGDTGISVPQVLVEGEDKEQAPCQSEAGFLRLDTGSLFQDLLEAASRGVEIPALARAFHWALAEGLADLALAGSRRTGTTLVGLSGGVMQNMSLLQLLKDKMLARGLTPLTHRSLPPNDGCISYGQMVWGLRNFKVR